MGMTPPTERKCAREKERSISAKTSQSTQSSLCTQLGHNPHSGYLEITSASIFFLYIRKHMHTRVYFYAYGMRI